MFFSSAFGLDENIIEVYDNEDVKLFCQNLVNIALEGGRCIGQSKRYHLVFEVAIASPRGHFPFIAFFDSHLLVSIGLIKLGEMSSSA